MKPTLFQAVNNDPNDSSTKRVLITSGVHGDETNAVLASYLLTEQIRKGKLRKTFENASSVKILMGVNSMGIENGVREYNGIDLNREMVENTPDDYDASSKRPIELITQIKNLIGEADIIIDIHNSENTLNHVLLDHDQGKLHTFLKSKNILSPMWKNDNQGTIKGYANKSGKIGVTIELGGMGYISKDKLDEELDFIKNVVEALLEFDENEVEENEPSEMKEIQSSNSGLIKWAREITNSTCEFKQGELICSIIDYAGNILEEIKAENDGEVICLCSSFYASPNTSLFTFNVEY